MKEGIASKGERRQKALKWDGEEERKEIEKYEKSREVHLFSKCPKKVVVAIEGGGGGERNMDTWPMTYIKVANDRAQTQSSVSQQSEGGVFKSVDLFFFLVNFSFTSASHSRPFHWTMRTYFVIAAILIAGT